MEDTKGEFLSNEFKLIFDKQFTICLLVELESRSARKIPEGCSREPLLQLQSLQAQDKGVSKLPVYTTIDTIVYVVYNIYDTTDRL